MTFVITVRPGCVDTAVFVSNPAKLESSAVKLEQTQMVAYLRAVKR